MMRTRPYFLTNPEWYTFDEEKFKYILTEKAPPEAIESYKEFYAEVTETVNGEEFIVEL